MSTQADMAAGLADFRAAIASAEWDLLWSPVLGDDAAAQAVRANVNALGAVADSLERQMAQVDAGTKTPAQWFANLNEAYASLAAQMGYASSWKWSGFKAEVVDKTRTDLGELGDKAAAIVQAPFDYWPVTLAVGALVLGAYVWRAFR